MFPGALKTWPYSSIAVFRSCHVPGVHLHVVADGKSRTVPGEPCQVME